VLLAACGRQALAAMWRRRAAMVGRGRRKERKSKGLGSNEFFSKVCRQTFKSVVNLKLYDFYFGSKLI
jgi:hypothetical protein